MALDIADLFNNKLPSAMAAKPDAAKAVGGTYTLKIAGAGDWNVDCNAPACTQGDKPADCTISIAAEDFQKLVENPSAGMQLFFAGKLKVQGNQMAAMKLQKLFDLVK